MSPVTFPNLQRMKIERLYLISRIIGVEKLKRKGKHVWIAVHEFSLVGDKQCWKMLRNTSVDLEATCLSLFSLQNLKKEKGNTKLRGEHPFVYQAKCVRWDNPYLYAVIQIHYTMRIGQLKIITSVSAPEHLTWWESVREWESERENMCSP